MVLAAAPSTVGAWALIVLSQIAAVFADATGQRAVRVVHKHSRRRMIIAFTLVSAVQILLVMSVLQLALPTSVTGTVYIHGQPSQCYKEYSQDGCCQSSGPSCSCVVDCSAPESHCTPISCPSQGPGSTFRFIWQHPFILINGVANTVYYLAETVLFRHPFGLVLLVMASLSSSLLFKPVGAIFGLSNATLPAGVLTLGAVGALMCIVDKLPTLRLLRGEATNKSPTVIRDSETELTDASSPFYELVDGTSSESKLSIVDSRAVNMGKTTPPKPRGMLREIAAALHVLPTVATLSLCYCLWFVFMRVFNDDYRCNAFGFNSMDQITLPVFVLPIMLLMSWAPLRKFVEAEPEACEESLWQASKHAMKELFSSHNAFWTVFTYRGVTNVRAICYSFLAIFYDLDIIYLQLTLVRVLTSWLGSVVLASVFPSFIAIRPEEKEHMYDTRLLVVRALGTVAVVIALFLLHADG